LTDEIYASLYQVTHTIQFDVSWRYPCNECLRNSITSTFYNVFLNLSSCMPSGYFGCHLFERIFFFTLKRFFLTKWKGDFFRDMEWKGDFFLGYIQIDQWITCILKKPLEKGKFEMFRERLG